jgi:hypothetical protein
MEGWNVGKNLVLGLSVIVEEEVFSTTQPPPDVSFGSDKVGR